jgi:acetylornithine deacetylase
MTPISSRGMAAIDREWLARMLAALVCTRSVTGEEDDAQEWMAKTLAEMGGEVDVWRVEPEALRERAGYPGARVTSPRQNVVATFRGNGGGPTLVLNGHIDTVTPGDESRWSHPPFGAEVVDGRLYGRGATDMKGGLTAILGAMHAIRKAGIRLKGTVQVQSVIGEEDGGIGAFAALTRGHVGDAVIICEPTQLAVIPVHAGVTLFRITVAGRAAHGCVRAEGVSAFERFLPIHAALKALEEERNRTVRHPLYDGMPLPWPLSIGMVQAGTWPAIVPERLTAEGRIGVGVGERIEDVRRQLEGAVERAAKADPWLAEHPPMVEWVGGVWEPSRPSPEHPVVQALERAAGEALGRPARLCGATYGSDLRLFTNQFGIPGVLFGPGDIRLAHFTDEYVPLAEVEIAARALTETILAYCGCE